MDLGSLSFPYSQKSDLISLSKACFTNTDDSFRYTFELQDGKCSATTKTETSSGAKVLEEPLEFVQNLDSDNVSAPLLTKVPATFFKIKLSLHINGFVNTTDRAIYILKSRKSPDVHQLQGGSLSPSTELSKINFQSLPLTSGEKDQKIVINDTFSNSLFQGCPLTVSLWDYDPKENSYTQLFQFKVYIEETNDGLNVGEATKKPSETATTKVSDFRKAFNFHLEDGPEFRKILSTYESEVSRFRKSVVGFSEEIKLLEHYLKRVNHSKSRIIDFFNQITAFQKILPRERMKLEFSRSLDSLFDPFNHNVRFLLSRVLPATILQKAITYVPVDSGANADFLGSVELSHIKKQFEARSKDYYSWLNKYLSNEKERPESKLLAKRKTFELSKFDYLNQLNMAFNNQYLNQVLENVFRFIHLSTVQGPNPLIDTKAFEDKSHESDLLSDEYTIYFNIISRFNSEKHQLRQLIEASRTNEELSSLIAQNRLNTVEVTDPESKTDDPVVTKSNMDIVFQRPSETENAVTAIPINTDQISEKSGILFTLGGQGKQGWHKEWIVLSRGRLTEYSDWRSGKSQVKKPIDIALTSVKAVNYDRRQYCFQISTSDGHHHTFQTFNEEERSKWLRALYNAGQQVDTTKLREDRGDKQVRKNSERRKNLGRLKTAGNHVVNTIIPGQTHDLSVSPVSIHSKQEKEMDYLAVVRSNPEDLNNICADCGSTEAVEWVSINFLTVFCVRCSSSHRSLGSHITRIKSLKLDKFADETEALLKFVSNRTANSYLETNLPAKEKISPTVSDANRLEFVKRKYVFKSYCEKYPDDDNLLVRAIQKINVPDVARYLACGADPNMNIKINVNKAKEEPSQFRTVTLFEYSLKKSIEVDTPTGSKKLFVVSELIILNGGKAEKFNGSEPQINEDNASELGLSEEAITYWKARRLRLQGLKSPAA
ncbi:Protein csx2 [Meyerozyma sp. JA9]|nr:Protein csx2 [Meyerozyma sp. JA9]